MAKFTKLPSGSWRVQVRRKGRYVSETFLRRENARRWATEAEGQVDRGDMPVPSRVKRLKTFNTTSHSSGKGAIKTWHWRSSPGAGGR